MHNNGWLNFRCLINEYKFRRSIAMHLIIRLVKTKEKILVCSRVAHKKMEIETETIQFFVSFLLTMLSTSSLASCSVSGNRKKKISWSTNVDKVAINNLIFLFLQYYFTISSMNDFETRKHTLNI